MLNSLDYSIHQVQTKYLKLSDKRRRDIGSLKMVVKIFLLQTEMSSQVDRHLKRIERRVNLKVRERRREEVEGGDDENRIE